MNELYNTTNTATKIRKTLLATASAFVLSAFSESAQAADNDRPTVWIEGGWHFESMTGKSDLFVPPLDAVARNTGLPSLTAIENALSRAYGAEGNISFQPKGSEWVFTASARYGRAQTTRRLINEKTIVGPPMLNFVLQPTANGSIGYNTPFTPTFDAYATHAVKNSEAHAIVDFQVGKDIGVGLLGRGTDSIISFGARYAQMNARSNAHSYANPDATFLQLHGGPKYFIRTYSHRSSAFVQRSDNFRGLGPALSLKNTTGLLGTVDEGQLALDWGVNAALLFGRQKAKTSHHSTVTHVQTQVGNTTVVHPPVTSTRSRMVTIPNIGAFAGLSYRFAHAKIGAGYRADFFFGARDGGLETRTTTDVGFHGPYATISIGLGG